MIVRVCEKERGKRRLQTLFCDQYSAPTLNVKSIQVNLNTSSQLSLPQFKQQVKCVKRLVKIMNFNRQTLCRPQKDGLGWELTCLPHIPMVEKSEVTREGDAGNSCLLPGSGGAHTRRPPSSVAAGRRRGLLAGWAVRCPAELAAGHWRPPDRSSVTQRSPSRSRFLLVSRSPIKRRRHHRWASVQVSASGTELSRAETKGPKFSSKSSIKIQLIAIKFLWRRT